MIRFTMRANLQGVETAIRRATEAGQAALDTQVIKDSNYYIPKDTGNLEGDAMRSSQIGSGKVIWNTPYARRLYYNPQYNFSKDTNPNASGLWFESGKSRFLSDWIRITQQIINQNL